MSHMVSGWSHRAIGADPAHPPLRLIPSHSPSNLFTANP